MEEKELIKEYLKKIEFSQYEAYIQLIEEYVKFKDDYLKSLEPVEEPIKPPKIPKETVGCKK